MENKRPKWNIYFNDGNGTKKVALWENISKKGETYYSGKIETVDPEIKMEIEKGKLLAFPIKNK